MSGMATSKQLRASYWRVALITVPAIVAMGSLMGYLSNSGYGNAWFDALNLPAITPPGWVFGAAWTVIYVLLGLSVAMILSATGARGRSFALILFYVQLGANYAWSPIFFGAKMVTLALYLIIFILMVSIATCFAFAPIRKAAAWLMVPYLAWLGFASVLTYQIDQKNPDAETLVPAAQNTQIAK